MLLLLSALIPALMGVMTPLFKKRGLRMAWVMLATLGASVLAGYVILRGGEERMELFRVTERFVCALRLDGAGKVYLSIAAVLWPLSVLYAIDYMRHEKREGLFFAWYTVAFSAAILLSAAENLFTLYIFYELLTLLTVPLVWHEQDKASFRAARTYMLYLFGGAALGFIAVMLVPFVGGGDGAFCLGGTPKLAAMSDVNPQYALIALLGFLGFGAKAAVLPLCRWLPKASVAPTPVTALLHAAAVVNAGVFAVLRLLYYVLPPALLRGSWAQTVMLALSMATVVYAAARAVREQHLKRRLAWSTVSNLSYMLFGLSLLSENGMAAGLSHMVFHSAMKITLFFCAGSVLTQTGRTQVREMHGLGRALPLTFGAYTLAGAALMGVPPLPGFVSKYALITSAFEAGGALAISGGVCLLISSVLTAIYIFTVALPAFFMRLRLEPGEKRPREGGACMRLTLALLCLLLIALSVFAGIVMRYMTDLTGGMGL